jgi:hypothetical protein
LRIPVTVAIATIAHYHHYPNSAIDTTVTVANHYPTRPSKPLCEPTSHRLPLMICHCPASSAPSMLAASWNDTFPNPRDDRNEWVTLPYLEDEGRGREGDGEEGEGNAAFDSTCKSVCMQ